MSKSRKKYVGTNVWWSIDDWAKNNEALLRHFFGQFILVHPELGIMANDNDHTAIVHKLEAFRKSFLKQSMLVETDALWKRVIKPVENPRTVTVDPFETEDDCFTGAPV